MGIDYSPVVSLSQVLGANTGVFYAWGPTARMLADVEDWLADPATNFGRLLLGYESQISTVKKFASKDHFLAVWHPQLTVELVLPPDAIGRAVRSHMDDRGCRKRLGDKKKGDRLGWKSTARTAMPVG